MTMREQIVERVARAINRASFNHHGHDFDKEEQFWKETRLARLAQAEAAIAALIGTDGEEGPRR